MFYYFLPIAFFLFVCLPFRFAVPFTQKFFFLFSSSLLTGFARVCGFLCFCWFLFCLNIFSSSFKWLHKGMHFTFTSSFSYCFSVVVVCKFHFLNTTTTTNAHSTHYQVSKSILLCRSSSDLARARTHFSLPFLEEDGLSASAHTHTI